MSKEMPNSMSSAAPEWLRSSVAQLEGNQRLDSVGHQLVQAAEPLTSGPAGDALRGRWLGHALHPLLTDFTLGTFLSAGLLDLLGGRKSRGAARRLIGLGLLFSVPTAASGMADYSAEQERDPRVRRVGVVHAVGNMIVAFLYFRSWRSRRQGHHLRGMAFSTLGGSLAMATGWLGGHMAIAYGAAEGERGMSGGTGSGGSRSVGSSVSTGGGASSGGGTAGGAAPMVDAGGDEDLIDVQQASDRLGVQVEQIQAMVDQGLLVPVAGGAAPRFRGADVEAVRLLGG